MNPARLSNQWLLVVTLVWLLFVILAAADDCNWSQLLEAVEHTRVCDPLLGRISTKILQTVDGNYSHICGLVQKYVDCMLPSFMCGSVLQEFHRNYRTYTAEPFNCHLHNSTILPYSGSSGNHNQVQTVIPDSQRAGSQAASNAGASSTSSSSSTLIIIMLQWVLPALGYMAWTKCKAFLWRR